MAKGTVRVFYAIVSFYVPEIWTASGYPGAVRPLFLEVFERGFANSIIERVTFLRKRLHYMQGIQKFSEGCGGILDSPVGVEQEPFRFVSGFICFHKIAEFIETIPGVKECMVIGVPHPEKQMGPVAFAVLDRSVFAEDSIAKETLNKACVNNLSESDIPLDWVFVDEFPRNLGGKIDSKLLVQMSDINYLKNQ